MIIVSRFSLNNPATSFPSHANFRQVLLDTIYFYFVVQLVIHSTFVVLWDTEPYFLEDLDIIVVLKIEQNLNVLFHSTMLPPQLE